MVVRRTRKWIDDSDFIAGEDGPAGGGAGGGRQARSNFKSSVLELEHDASPSS